MSDRTPGTRAVFPGFDTLYDAIAWLSYPLMRVFAGLFLVPHGAQKLFGWFGGSGLDGVGAFFENTLGLTPGIYWAIAVGGTEFVGGILIAVGLLTRAAALGAATVLITAVFVVNMPNGFFASANGYEFEMLWAIIMIGILLRGGGPMSLDSLIGYEL